MRITKNNITSNNLYKYSLASYIQSSVSGQDASEVINPSLHKIQDTLLYQSPETPRQVALVKEMLSFISSDCDYKTYRNIIWGLMSSNWSFTENPCHERSMGCPSRLYQKNIFID